MELSRRLPKFFGRLDDLEELLGSYAPVPSNDVRSRYVIERALLQLQIEWELFVRGVILDSATGKFTSSGVVVASGLSRSAATREQAAHLLIAQYKKRNKEPDWYLPADAIHAAKLLKLTNASGLALELGVSPWELEPLRHIRNFITHQSKSAALNVRASGLHFGSGSIDAVDTCYAYARPGVQTYATWVAFMKYVGRQIVG